MHNDLADFDTARNVIWRNERRRKRVKDALWIAAIIAAACLVDWAAKGWVKW
jgi:hypothetical protein